MLRLHRTEISKGSVYLQNLDFNRLLSSLSVRTGNLYEDGTRRFIQTTAADCLAQPNSKVAQTCSAERCTHKALQGPSGWGYKEAEMNLTNDRPSPGDISSAHHWSSGWLSAGPTPHTPASKPSLAQSAGRNWVGEEFWISASQSCVCQDQQFFQLLSWPLEERWWKVELKVEED